VVLDLVLPQRCIVCAAAGRQLCSACRDSLPRIAPPLCERCGAPTAWPVERCRECSGRRLGFATARAAVVYDAAVRRLVAGWKERGLRALAGEAAGIVAERIARPDDALLAFVPADAARRLQRGHNPAEKLAEALADVWALPCEQLLSRVGVAHRQRGLSLVERRRNIAGAFEARESAGRPVVLVDDVYTSGATASAAATVLRRAGAPRVDVVSFARAIRVH
jgi:predicted amidophosphoribosyltransferase